MPTISVEVSDEVAEALTFQARALLLGRRHYIRAVLAAVAEQSRRDRESGARPEPLAKPRARDER